MGGIRAWLAAAAMLLVPAAAAEAETGMETRYRGTPTPPYRVERVVEGAEIRAYGATLVAEVTVGGSRSGAANAGFRILAGYIFGGNDSGAKIAMTTPVAQAPGPAPRPAPGLAPGLTPGLAPGAGARTWTIRFTMPPDWTPDRLPAPGDGRIRIVEMPPRRLVALRFGGGTGDAALAGATDRIIAIAGRAGLETEGDPEFLFYDSPFTLPWNRRNEVALRLR